MLTLNTTPVSSSASASSVSSVSSALKTPSSAPSCPPSPSVSSVLNTPALPPRERAFALYCQGQRSPAIATRLGVPERTIRTWINGTLRKLAEENAAQRRQHQALAIARYEAISNAAWEGYARAAALEIHTLETTLAVSAGRPLADHIPQSAAESATPFRDPSDPSSSFVPSVLKTPSSGARYLAVAMAADREISRLQGLYLPEATKPHNDVKIILERREPTAENYPPGEYPGAYDHNAPIAAPPDPARDGGLCGGTPLGADSSAGSPAAAPTPDSPAESATPYLSASDPSASSVLKTPSSPVMESPLPSMPRIYARHSSDDIARLANRGYDAFRWP